MDVDEIANLAARLHNNKVDKAGQPYIGHLQRVADTVKRSGGSESQVEAAWLHDSVEDTDATIEDLASWGVSSETIKLIAALTHREGESRTDYLGRVIATPQAILIKLADNHDNSDPARLALLDEITQLRLRRKYGETLIRLS